MKFDATEVITYLMILAFIIGIFYVAFEGTISKKSQGLKEGEIVQGEKELKESISKDLESMEDEIDEIGEMIK